jgi:hypothetical protein
MRRAAKTDRNQTAIVDALREAGCRVQSLAVVGQGCPDLLVGHRGNLCLLEVKDGTKTPSARKLTPEQEEWHRAWSGYPVHVVETTMAALIAVGVVRAA